MVDDDKNDMQSYGVAAVQLLGTGWPLDEEYLIMK